MNAALEKFAPALTSFITLVIYFFTMSRGVMPIDAGELAATQYTFGIAHPSGYPLFNLLGFLWSKLPIGSVIFRLNLLCAIYVSLANFFLVKTAFLVIQKSFQPKPAQKKVGTKTVATQIESPILFQMLAAMSGILMLAFCRTWWIQSAGVEVYSLHIALLAAFFFAFTNTYYLPNPTTKNWLISGILLGLCFTNHLTSVLILPGVVILYFMKMKFSKNAVKPGLILVAGFTIIFIMFYGLMMMRAGSSPLTNYGNPNNMEYLKRHVTGWQFQTFLGSDEKKANSTFSNFFSGLPNEMSIIGLLLFLAGAIYIFMKNPKMGVFWSLNFISALIYASQYDIHDIENYFLLCYMAAGIFMSFAVYWIFELAKGLQKNKGLAYGVLLLPILPLILNYNQADQSKLHYIDQYSQAALNSVEDNAIILTREWDVFVSPAYYYHLVEKQRPDVLILDKELLRRSWYHTQIKAWDKVFAANIEKPSTEFAIAVQPFERMEKFDANEIQQKFEAYLTAILAEYKNRPVYISSLVLDADIASRGDVKLPAGTVLVPDAYFYRLVPADTSIYYPLSKPLEYNVSFTADKKENKFQRQILNFSMNVLSSRVGYEMNYGKKAEARKIIEIMQSIDPSVSMPEGL